MAISVKYSLVTVSWVDSCSPDGGWTYSKQIVKDYEPSEVRSIGWLVRETDTALVLASHVANPDDADIEQVDGLMAIPKVAIVARAEMPDPLA